MKKDCYEGIPLRRFTTANLIMAKIRRGPGVAEEAERNAAETRDSHTLLSRGRGPNPRPPCLGHSSPDTATSPHAAAGNAHGAADGKAITPSAARDSAFAAVRRPASRVLCSSFGCSEPAWCTGACPPEQGSSADNR